MVLLSPGDGSASRWFSGSADLLPRSAMPFGTPRRAVRGQHYGKALHTLIGYVSRPDGIQILFYMARFYRIF